MTKLFETIQQRQARLIEIKAYLDSVKIKYTAKSKKGIDGLFIDIDGQLCDIAGYTLQDIKGILSFSNTIQPIIDGFRGA